MGRPDEGAGAKARLHWVRIAATDSLHDLPQATAALRAAGCEVIRAEKRSGTTTAGREELRTMLEFLRKGDTLTTSRRRPLHRVGLPVCSILITAKNP
jgi:DNA invertase Pin-like site-specific DNA recombinase